MVPGGVSVRVLHVTGFLPPHFGGVESYVTGLARQLVAMGIEVDVATSEGHGCDGVRMITCPSRLSVLGNPIMRGLKNVVVGGGYDIVHLHSPPQIPALQASRICKAERVPYVLTYHCDGEVSHPALKPTIPAFMGTVGNRILEGASRIIVTTNAQSYLQVWTPPGFQEEPTVASSGGGTTSTAGS